MTESDVKQFIADKYNLNYGDLTAEYTQVSIDTTTNVFTVPSGEIYFVDSILAGFGDVTDFTKADEIFIKGNDSITSMVYVPLNVAPGSGHHVINPLRLQMSFDSYFEIYVGSWTGAGDCVLYCNCWKITY
jgi:hypothetical protein